MSGKSEEERPLIIFDWDGTIIDSAEKIIRCMQIASNDVGLIEPTDDSIRNIIGLGLPEAIYILHKGINESTMCQLRDQYSKRFIEADLTPCPFFPDVEKTLDILKRKGWYLAVATGKSRRGMKRVLDNLDWHDKFDGVRCADETASKPNPLMLNELLALFDVTANSAIMVGDTSYDLEMAQKAGVQSIGVSYGAHSVASLNRYNPIGIIDNFLDLTTILDEWQLIN